MDRHETWVVMTGEQVDDFQRMSAAIEDAILNPPTAEQAARRAAYEAARDALYSDDLSDFSPAEVAAVNALYNDPDIEVGSEGIGGFYAGQAEATIRTLHKAGFEVIRFDTGADP